jgi:hypothetical protein
MFGDNQAVVTNSTIPDSSLNNRHNALYYHIVREVMFSDYFRWVALTVNPIEVNHTGSDSFAAYLMSNAV